MRSSKYAGGGDDASWRTIASGPSASTNRATCSGTGARAMRLRPGALRNGTSRFSDRAHHAERTGTSLDKLRASDPERLGQGLERRDLQFARHPEPREPNDDTAEQQQRAPAGAPPAPDGKCTRERAEPTHEVERPFGRNQVEHPHRRGGTDPRPREIRRIYPCETVPEHHQRTSDAGSGEEERDSQKQLDDQQPTERAGRPGRIEHVERHALGDDEAHWSGQSEPERSECEEGLDAGPNPLAQHQQERAARPEAEQGHADHQEGEVVPLHDREQPGEQNFVAESSGGEHRHRDQHRETDSRPVLDGSASTMWSLGAHGESA